MKAKAITPKRPKPNAIVASTLNSSIAAEKSAAASAAKQAFLDPEQRRAMIAESAYYKAEHRGFASGYEVEDWLAAETEIDSELAHESLLSA